MESPQLENDLIYLVMQYLNEEKFKEALHSLERESGMFFNLKHFEEIILAGKWNEVEKYLSGFTKLEDNRHSLKIYFEIRKQSYLEALDNNDKSKAVDILKHMKVFADTDPELFKEMTQLLVLENFREYETLATYTDARSVRRLLAAEVKKLIKANPLFRDKLQFPNMEASRLSKVINQSLNWQHYLCPKTEQIPDINTLYVDHSCSNSNEPIAQYNQPLLNSPTPRADPRFLFNEAFRIQSPPDVQTVLPTQVSVPVIPAHQTVSVTAPPPNALPIPAVTFKQAPAVRERTLPAANAPTFVSNWAEEFPNTVSRVLIQDSAPICMDFHPIQQTRLLVGTNVGEISLWEASTMEKLATENFQIGLVEDQSVLVTKLLWTTEGNLFGAAFSKNAVHLYRYHGGNDIRKYLEFEAHIGSVNDLAFSSLAKILCLITCGDDKLVKVWDVGLGSLLYKFKGHLSPVSSVCPYSKENVNYLFSTSVDGRIKLWSYNVGATRVNYEIPGRACTELTYSADGKRLFSCGTSKEGESHIIEWDETEGSVKRAYQGLSKNCEAAIQFGITKNRYLAAGDDHCIKVWDMDNENMLTMISADGDLPASPRIRFNKDGSLLAVSTNNKKIKILATVDGIHLLRTYENHSFASPRLILETGVRNGVVEITEPSQLRSLRLTTLPNVEKISRLLFSNSGFFIVALASNGTHLLWKWPRVDPNLSIKATTKVAPDLMSQPASGNIMINDLTNVKPENTVSCIALSKTDSYLMSASGGKSTLFNTITSKIVAQLAPVPVAMCFAFYPHNNNVVAIGMNDCTLHIYNTHTDKVTRKLEGHTKSITGLAFSNVHRILVSSGANSQIVAWNSESWEVVKSRYLNIPEEKAESATQVQFHMDKTHFLVTHEIQLSIYEATELECMKQWEAGDSSPLISQASFSSDCQQVYVIFLDGAIQIFGAANLQPQCRISPSAYLPTNLTSGAVVPRVMAVNPKEANMLAVGLSDGGVVVLEPLETETKWGVPTPAKLLPPPAVAVPGDASSSTTTT